MNIIALQASGGGMGNIIMLVAMFAIIYFFMIRPQMTRQKKEKAFQAGIKKGMKVVTTSGIHGKVVDISTTDTTVMIETNAGKIRFERSAISMEMTNKYQKQ